MRNKKYNKIKNTKKAMIRIVAGMLLRKYNNEAEPTKAEMEIYNKTLDILARKKIDVEYIKSILRMEFSRRLSIEEVSQHIIEARRWREEDIYDRKLWDAYWLAKSEAEYEYKYC